MTLRPVVDLVKALLAIPGAIFRLLRAMVRLLCRLFHRKPESSDRHKGAPTGCVPITDKAMRVPDPLVYSQYDLMARGLPVTWENPDFAIFHGTTKVASHELLPDTAYFVDVRVWNSAPDCPVAMMPVHLSFLDFGMGAVSVPVGTALVDVGVIGAPNNPAFVRFNWHTPPTPGHYCLQALLDPASDRNRANNLGQHNTSVVEAHSPGVFAFTLRNDTKREHRYEFDVDAYVLRTPECAELEKYRRDLGRHLIATPVPPGWRVELAPLSAGLAPGGVASITVTVTPPDAFVGRQRINVHAFYIDGHQRVLAGGVSVDVTKVKD